MALAFVLAIAAAPALAREVTSQELGDDQPMSYPEERAPGDQCDQGHSGYYWTIGSWFTGEESYAVYCDPTECTDCTGSWKPLSVTIYLYWEEENSCALTVHAEIVDADLSNPSCPTPGSTVLSTSVSMTAGPFSPAGLWAVTIQMPEDCQGFTGPFFASVVFEDTCDDKPQLVADADACGDCETWNDWGIGWDELCTYGFPGNVSIFTSLECIGSSPVQQSSWGAIKGIYR
jgi:hypothetical protein